MSARGEPRGLLQAWERTARRRTHERAIVQASDGISCTFGELAARAEAWRATHAIDAESFTRRLVVFSAPNGIGWFELFLGLLRAGAIVVPLDAAEPAAAQQRIAQALRAAFWWDGNRLVSVEGARRCRDASLCLVKLTSGTTGQPRPLFFTDEQMLADAQQVTSTMGIRTQDLNYALIPLGHSYGLGNLTLPLVAQGVPLVCGSMPLPHAVADEFVRWQPTVFPGVPAMWRALASANVEADKLASLRLAISAGAPLAPEIAQRFAAKFGRRLRNFYGSSETGGIAYDRSGAATLRGAVGLPLRNVRVASQRGQRLRVCSAAVFTHGNRLGGLGCWLPPDRVRIDARGHLTLLGRRGTLVKIAGRRVDLTEVANRLRRIEGVGEAWVAASEGAEPTLGAAVIGERSAAELRAELQADFPTWKIPKKWAMLAEFPLTARGKLDVRALRAQVFGSG